MRRAGRRYLLLATLLVLVLATLYAARPALAYAGQLLRYPYLTDVVGGYATLNWGTDRSFTVGSATYGLAGRELCTAHRATGTKTAITVGANQNPAAIPLPRFGPVSGVRQCSL